MEDSYRDLVVWGPIILVEVWCSQLMAPTPDTLSCNKVNESAIWHSNRKILMIEYKEPKARTNIPYIRHSARD